MRELIKKIKTEGLLNQEGINEEDTKCLAIEPLLRCLGWKTDLLSEVKREYPNGLPNAGQIRDNLQLSVNETLCDYVLMIDENIKIIIEVKPPNKNLCSGGDKERNLNWEEMSKNTFWQQWLNNIFNIAKRLTTVKYIVLTTGDRFLIWDVTHHHGINQKPIYINFDQHYVEFIYEKLNILSKEKFK